MADTAQAIPQPESRFPTIKDLRDGLTRLVESGLGDFPAQIIIVPGSTMEAVARHVGGEAYDQRAKRPLMIEFDGVEGRMPMSMLSTEYLDNLRTTQ